MTKKKPLKLTTRLMASGNNQTYLEFSPEIGEMFDTGAKTRRVVCTLNGEHTFQCALSPNKGKFVIGVNTAIRKKLSLVPGDKVTVKLVADDSKYGAEMPEELAEVMRQDSEGDKLFHALTTGRQRTLIYMIAAPKSIDKRIHLSLVVMEHLKENDGKVIIEKLDQDIKRPMF